MPGEGSIYRRADGKWLAQIEAPGSGRRRRRFIRRIRSTKPEARAALAELLDDRRAGVTRTRLTVGDFLVEWVASVRNIRPTTRHGYEVAVEYHLVPALGHIRLSELAPLHVERAIRGWLERVSPKHARNIHAVLRTALNDAVRKRMIPINVAGREYVDAPRVPDREPNAFSHDEVRALLDAAAGHWLEPAVIVALGTGLRSGELRGLAWEDVDLEHHQLHVRRELVRRDGAYLRDELKTGSKARRTIPLAAPIAAALERQRQQLIDAGLLPTSTGPVFVRRDGVPLNDGVITHQLYDLEARAGIRRLPWKDLRSTFATRLFEAGIPDLRVQELLGHTTPTTTRRHYIGRAEEWAPAIAAVEALVG